jgi:hypothetical protein
MELTTFGILMKFAIERETDIANLLENMKGREPFASLGDWLGRWTKESQKNLQLLERTRRENINEVILHTISGLEDSRYLVQPVSVEGMSPGELGNHLIDMIDSLVRFYNDAAGKLANKEVSRAFSRLAEKKHPLREEIRKNFVSP